MDFPSAIPPVVTTGIESLISSVEYAVSVAKKNYNGYVCYCDQKMFEMIERKREIVKILKEKIADILSRSFQVAELVLNCVKV